jgi:antitoxin YefM
VSTAKFTEVRENLSEFLDMVESGEELIITRRGRPVAVVVALEDYEAMTETLNILTDDDAMAAIAEAEDDISHGDVTAFD